MTTKVNKTIMVNVPISTAYRQWTRFEEFPHFMGGVERVTRLGDDRLEWVAEIAGVHRRWEARIVQQDVDRAVAWAAVDGVKNAGWVDFKEAGPSQTSLHLSLEYEPHGVLEFLGDKLHVIERQAESDLKKFKEYIEKQAPEASAPTATPATTSGPAGTTGTAAAAVDPSPGAPDTTPIVDPVTHPFDQTNGLADLDGDSDETADSDTRSAAERKDDEDRGEGFIPPMGGLPGQR
ncbi:ribosome-associated toxin RatA of RatAB toxin-antitoxin module [Paenarthrobacter nitroguajacolicus]|uniref:SRPBCC family protein n=1 Tax=Paenarthrobacter nitroguajacolicus TaxID=211146 RepID=UPI00285E5D30|nr:SRPBCC family protein [Paenarthrobacter nitroguajacolicus]MDR6989538.1 ribosome-associated toxin RatA of RatAB toxin-antitoxin module [Paenarthrobacter nitroguajacolicus]